MSRQLDRHVPWDFMSGVLLTSLYTTTSVAMPQYTFSSLTPHLPVTALVVSVAVGLLMTLIYYYGAAHRAGATAAFLGFLWAALTTGPFILAWYLLSWQGYPLWPAIFAGYILPLLLLVTTIWQDPTPDIGLQLFARFPQLRQAFYLILLLLTSLYFGFGIPLLAIFTYAQVVQRAFGSVVFVHWSLIAVGGAMLSGGLYGLLHRAS